MLDPQRISPPGVAAPKGAKLKAQQYSIPDIRQLKARACGQWLSPLAFLAPSLTEAIAKLGRHVPCPIHGGKDGFRLFPNAAETGGGICNTCGFFSDGIALLQPVNRWTVRETVLALAGYFGMIGEAPVRISKAPSNTPTPNRTNEPRGWAWKALREAWQGSVAPDHPDAEPLRLYLANRRILTNPFPADLRFHAALPFKHEGETFGTFPVMLALVRNPEGEPVSIHRTYLTSDGQKATVTHQGERLSPKRLMPAIFDGATNGGAIRLFESGSRLAVAEGLETALSVYLDTVWPVWSTVSAGGMERLIVPSHVGEVLIAADNDPTGAGINAARKLAKRLQGEGKRVRIALPPAISQDWNDVMKAARNDE